MRLTSIEIQGFRAFAKPERFDVDADAVIVSAPNGRGKTSLFDAVLWGMSGVIPRLRDDAQNVISLYSETGEARVALHLSRDGSDGPYVIRRAYDGTQEQLQVEVNGMALAGPLAQVRLLTDLWADAVGAGDVGQVIADRITRGIYLQQDLVRQFVEADGDTERFQAISDLIGTGRVAELQKQLETSRRSWSTATNTKRQEEEALRERVAALENEVARLSTDEGESLSDIQGSWRGWWEEAKTLGVESRRPSEPSSVDAQQALDAAIKELQALRRAVERRLQVATMLSAEFEAVAHIETSDVRLEELRRTLGAAQERTRLAREDLMAAERGARELRRSQVEGRERREERRVLAQVALRHLGEHCPVCSQAIDEDAVRRHLETVARGERDDASGSDQGSDVGAAADRLARCEADEDLASRRLRDAEREAAGRVAQAEERQRRLIELGEPVEGDARAALNAIRRRLVELVERFRRHETAGEGIGLALARAGEHARRVELRQILEGALRELDDLQREVLRRQETSKLADRIVDALREIGSDVVGAKLTSIDPLLRRIYAKVDPHPAFRDTRWKTSMSYGRGRLSMTLYDAIANVAAAPLQVMSSSQMNALAVSVFLSLNLGMASLPIDLVILDDPLQSLDDVNLLGVADLLRRIKDRRQLFVSTHDARFSHLLQRKLRPTLEAGRTRLVELEGWSRLGPTVQQMDVVADDRAVRMVATA